MIDDSDGDFAALLSIGSRGAAGGLFFLALAIVLYLVAASNKAECAEMTCHHGTARLIQHECLCVDTPTGAERTE